MPSEPQIKLLEYNKRKQFFWLLVLVFVVALPAMIFYTSGNRLNFGEGNAIITTGGIYITTDNLEVDVYLNQEEIKRPRLFRSAYYIQNIDAGQHRVVVQQEGLYTWVKELPVDPYIVTEAAAFNMPIESHLRLIAPYETATSTQVFSETDGLTSFLNEKNATTTVPFLVLPQRATTSYEINEEYDFVASLFSTTSTSTVSVFERVMTQVERFRFATTSVDNPTATTSTFVEQGNMRIVEEGDELQAQWVGSTNVTPYYFCVASSTATTTAARYGEHVARQIDEQALSTTTPLAIDGNRICRQKILLDRKRQDVFFYDFFPGTTDLVLLQLEDGLYVTEIDDRAWQNTQRIYLGNNFTTVIDNGSIYIQDEDIFFELITEIESN